MVILLLPKICIESYLHVGSDSCGWGIGISVSLVVFFGAIVIIFIVVIVKRVRKGMKIYNIESVQLYLCIL